MSFVNIFSLDDYKLAIQNIINNNVSVRGYRSRLAEAAGFQASFLSQVLKGHAHITPEHAYGIALFWELTPLERDYFLELVNFARAGTPELRGHVAVKLKTLREQQTHLQQRYQVENIANREGAGRYYSSWLFGAVHALSGLPEYQTTRAMAQRLNTSEETICEILVILEQLGLVAHKNGRWILGTAYIHVGKENPLSVTNHMNWRQRAFANMVSPQTNHDVHYSSVCTLSKIDYERLSEMIRGFLDDSRRLIAASEEEEAAVLCLDFFPL